MNERRSPDISSRLLWFAFVVHIFGAACGTGSDPPGWSIWDGMPTALFFLLMMFVAAIEEPSSGHLKTLRYTTWGAIGGACLAPLTVHRRLDMNEGVVPKWIALVVGGAFIGRAVGTLGQALRRRGESRTFGGRENGG